MLTIKLKKTEIMEQPHSTSNDFDQDKQIGQVLTQVNKFKYCGTTFANNNRLDSEVGK